MASRQKHKAISLETKYKVIKLLDNCTPYPQILDQFRDELRGPYNISKIKKNRDQIIAAYETSTSTQVKTLRGAKYPEIESALIEFIGDCNSKGLPINSLLLKEKANQIAKNLKIVDFNCSNGFIDRFKKRNAVEFQIIHGVSDGVPEDISNDWINKKLPELIKDYEPNDIFNGDEFGLFWRILPNKTYKMKGKKFKSGKKSLERISVFVCANMTGTEKLKPIVIGRAREPRCFRGKKSLPVIYKNNNTSWMKSDIFSEFLKKLNKDMLSQNRKIALILDNCSSHPVMTLSNIKLIFLPPNTTSVLQPMDMGVIHAIKCLYRVKVARKLLALIETKPNPTPKDIDLYDALIMLKQSWDEISVETVKNCFVKSGFQLNSVESIEMPEIEDINVWDELTAGMNIRGANFSDYVDVDNEISTVRFQSCKQMKK
jgi:hypothetical protein